MRPKKLLTAFDGVKLAAKKNSKQRNPFYHLQTFAIKIEIRSIVVRECSFDNLN
jgi:hypothetical protein